MSSLISRLVLFNLVALCTAAHSADTSERRFRINVDGGFSSVPRDGGREAFNSDPVLGLSVGMALDERWSVEVFQRSLSLAAGLLSTEYTPDTHLGLALRGSLPLSEAWRVMGWLGWGRTKSSSGVADKSDLSEAEASFGLGVAYQLSPAWSLQLSSTRLTQTQVTTTLFGGEYRF